MAKPPRPSRAPEAPRAPAAATPAPTTDRRRVGQLAVALAIVTVAVYAQVGGFGFVSYDDPEYVTANATVQQGLSTQTLGWAFAAPHHGNYNPLTWASHLTDVSLFGLQPGGHHLHNLLLHLANSLLLLWILWRATGHVWAAAFVAAAFALHPQHVESVAWVSDRKDLVAAFFGLLSLAAWGRYARTGHRAAWGAAFAAFLASLLAKPMLVTLPAVLLLLDAWPLQRWRPSGPGKGVPLRTLLVEKIPFLVAVLPFVWVSSRAQAEIGALVTDEELALPWRVGNAIVSYAVYAGKTLWPSGLAVHYPHPGPALPLPHVVLALGLLLALTVGAWLVRRERAVPVGWLLYAGLLVPVAGVVQLGQFARADRFTYLPIVGLFVALAWGTPALARRFGLSPAWPRWVGGAVLVGWTAVTLTLVPTWASSETLFARAVAVTPPNAVAHYNLGVALADRGDTAGAEAQYRAALQVRGDDARSHNNLANLLVKRGGMAEAVDHYLAALKTDPSDVEVMQNLAYVLEKLDRKDDAIRWLDQALSRLPGDPATLRRLGVLLLQVNRTATAEARFRSGVELHPEDAGLRDGLATALARQGKWSEAVAQWRAALTLLPQPPAGLLHNLAIAEAQVKRLAPSALPAAASPVTRPPGATPSPNAAPAPNP